MGNKKLVARMSVVSLLIFWVQNVFAAVAEAPILEDAFLSLAASATGGPGLAFALFMIMVCGFVIMTGSGLAKKLAIGIFLGIIVVWGAAIIQTWIISIV